MTGEAHFGCVFVGYGEMAFGSMTSCLLPGTVSLLCFSAAIDYGSAW